MQSSLGILAISALLLLALPQLVPWVMQKLQKPEEATDPKFEVAYQSVLILNDRASGYASRLGGFNSYGITQLDYDTWRQLNGKPVEELINIQDQEIKAIYREHWEGGDCSRYESPLDVACLDSSVSFGTQPSKQFLTNLPADPVQAAMAVADRRKAFRQRQIHPPITPTKQLAIRDGLRRDRALSDLIASGELPKAAVPSPEVIPDHSTNQPSDTLPSNQIYSKVKPSTVEVWNNTQRGIATTASGIILTSEGLVLTNHHVVENNPRPSVALADGRKFTGRVTSIDPELDLALIQLDRASGLPTVPFAQDTSQIKVGDTVYAIGSPLGESWKMTTSQVIELHSTCANGTSPLRCIRTPKDFLHPGNSGGPLIDARGQVIGVNRAVQQSTGEGVSIPVETIQHFLDNRMGYPPQSNPFQAPTKPRQTNPSLNQPQRWL